LLLFFCEFATAQEIAQEVAPESKVVVKKSAAKPAKEAPTKIRSDIIDIKRKSQSVNFIGNVIIEKEDSTFTSQKMTILYDEEKEEKEEKNPEDEKFIGPRPQEKSKKNAKNKSAPKSSIKKIYTDQKVKIFSEEFVATGDSGYYDPKADIFVLEENVEVNNGVSVATGDKFVHHIATKKSNFVGKKQEKTTDVDNRVRVILGDDAKEFKKSKEKK